MFNSKAGPASIITVLAIACATMVGDTLFKARTPVAIGVGETDKNVVRWRDCDGKKQSTYVKPPYWVDKADNCHLHPADFGLREKDGKYFVEDKAKIAAFFPNAEIGDQIRFHISKNTVVLTRDGQEIALERRGPEKSRDGVEQYYVHEHPREHQLTGCLQKSPEGSGFLLTNGRYKKGVEVKSSEDLSPHVGHEVKMTGTWEKAMAGGKVGASGKEMATFDATHVQHVSDTCGSATGKDGKHKVYH